MSEADHRPLSKAQVPGAKSLKGIAVGGHHVRVDRLGRGDEPRVVLAQPSRGASLQ
jgi:hypothetical protein